MLAGAKRAECGGRGRAPLYSDNLVALLRIKVIAALHASPIGGHSGIR